MGWVMRRRGQHLALCWARRRPGGSSGAGAMQARLGWVLQGSRACVSGGTGANPCGMPWPGERGRPRRLGAGSVGFQGSCRAGAATGTDGGRAGPAPRWGSWLGLEVLAVPTALPWPQVLLSLWPVGQGRSCPGLCAWLCGVAGGTHCPLPVLPTRPGLSEVFPSAQGISLALMLSLGPVGSSWLCHHSGLRVTPPSWDTRGDTAGAILGSGTWELPSPAACGCPSGAALGGQSRGPPSPSPSSDRWLPCREQCWGHGMCRIRARGWAGFLRQKIPGRSAGGPGLAVSPQNAGWGNPVDTVLAWGAAAAPSAPLWGPGDLGCAHAVSAGGWQCLSR